MVRRRSGKSSARENTEMSLVRENTKKVGRKPMVSRQRVCARSSSLDPTGVFGDLIEVGAEESEELSQLGSRFESGSVLHRFESCVHCISIQWPGTIKYCGTDINDRYNHDIRYITVSFAGSLEYNKLIIQLYNETWYQATTRTFVRIFTPERPSKN